VIRLAAALVALAAPALAEGGPSAESRERLAQAIAAAGCEVNEINQGTILDAAEMEEAEAGVIVSTWVEAGEAEYGDGTLRLLTGRCAR
jgi:hypothetical protein